MSKDDLKIPTDNKVSSNAHREHLKNLIMKMYYEWFRLGYNK
jgi:hypothetical protein